MEMLKAYVWLIQIAGYFVGALIFQSVFIYLYGRIIPYLVRSRHVWDDTFLSAAKLPLLTFVWASVLTFIVPLIVQHFDLGHQFFSQLSLVRELLLTTAIFWFVFRFIKNMETKLYTLVQKKGKLNHMTVRACVQIVRILVVVVFILVAMKSLGIDISALLAFGGIGGLALSLAAKDSLANMFGGAMVYFNQPFAVGDWIRSPDRNIEGTVEDIGLRMTLVRTFDKRPLYIPNGIFSNILIENPSRMLNRRIYHKIGVRYKDAKLLRTIVSAIDTMLRSHKDIDANQTLMVKVIELGEFSVNFMVYTFTKTTNWVEFQSVQEDVLLRILEIIEQNGAECPAPIRALEFSEPLTIKTEKI